MESFPQFTIFTFTKLKSFKGFSFFRSGLLFQLDIKNYLKTFGKHLENAGNYSNKFFAIFQNAILLLFQFRTLETFVVYFRGKSTSQTIIVENNFHFTVFFFFRFFNFHFVCFSFKIFSVLLLIIFEYFFETTTEQNMQTSWMVKREKREKLIWTYVECRSMHFLIYGNLSWKLLRNMQIPFQICRAFVWIVQSCSGS